MIRTQLYIPDNLYNEAKMYAKADNKTISHFVREGLKLYLATSRADKKNKTKKKDKIAKFVGKYSFPNVDKNAAMNHNDIYDI